jgi:hypothetical protein
MLKQAKKKRKYIYILNLLKANRVTVLKPLSNVETTKILSNYSWYVYCHNATALMINEIYFTGVFENLSGND